MAALLIALVAGLLMFAVLTRRLRRLSLVMSKNADCEADQSCITRYPRARNEEHEIGQLGQ